MKLKFILFSLTLLLLLSGCGKEETNITTLSMLQNGKTFAVPTGTVADQSVLKKFPDAKIKYYNSVLDCAIAVKEGMADAAVYDKPVLENIAAKNEGVQVLSELLFDDLYGFAVRLQNKELKTTIDEVLAEIKSNGTYGEMMKRWFPSRGEPGPMPEIQTPEINGVLRFGTAAVTEPMSYLDASHKIAGFDIEFASYVAKKLNKRLEIVDMEFGAMLPALIAGKVDMIGAGLSITEERAKKVLFSESYYPSGIAALVKTGSAAGEDASVAAPAKYSKVEDLSDKKIGVFTGTVHDAFIDTTYPKAQILRYESTADMIMSLKSGKIDATMFDLITAGLVVKHNDDLAILADDVLDLPLGVGFSKKNPALLKEFNDFLKEIRKDGTYDEMCNRWFLNDAEDAVMPAVKTITSEKKLNVGVSVEDLPYVAFMNGQYVGFDIEMIQRFALSRKYQLEITMMEFPSLVASLAAGKVDMITDGICITKERAKQVNFSDAYADFRTAVLVLKKNMAGYNGPSDDTKEVTLWQSVKESFYSNIVHESRYLLIIEGLEITGIISIFAALFGTIIGGIICFMRMSKRKLLSGFAGIYISLLRGTPVLVLLMITYYVVFASVNINPVIVAVLAFGLNFGAYVSEMFRTSIESIDRGQKEAGIAGGFTKIQTFLYIIMPQALRQVLPVYKGEFISLVKMTSIVGYIAVQDLTKASDIIRSRTFDAFFPLIMAAVLYLVIAWLLTLALSYIEVSVDPKRKRISIGVGK